MTPDRRYGLGVVSRLAVAAITLSSMAAPALAQCVGDCNVDQRVTVNELTLAVNIALGNEDISECEVIDADGNGICQINELITAVNNALNACDGPAPTPTPEGVRLGERAFSIAKVEVFPSRLPGDNIALEAEPVSLIIEAGVPDENGVASLRLKEDVIIGFTPLLDYLCLKLTAEGSSGTIACDGGVAYGVRATVEGGAGRLPTETETGRGNDAGPGGATLLVTLEYALLPEGSVYADCFATDQYWPPEVFALTTATGTSIKGEQELSVRGENFICGEDGEAWRMEDGPGMLVLGLGRFDIRAGGTGNLAQVIRLADTE